MQVQLLVKEDEKCYSFVLEDVEDDVLWWETGCADRFVSCLCEELFEGSEMISFMFFVP